MIVVSNIFLSRRYLEVLDKSAPKNMVCHYIGIFKGEKLVGIAITQLLNLTNVASFGVNKSCIKSKIRDFVFKYFADNVLFVGNNMLTGQNAYVFLEEIEKQEGLSTLNQAVTELKKVLKISGKKVTLTSFKDFTIEESVFFKIDSYKKYYQFSTQPNMIFTNQNQWKTEEDYVAALAKKYRDHYKRARKKMEQVSKHQMTLDDIIKNNDAIYELYYNVTKNAPFNTFYLAKNHFVCLKENLKENFLFYGYFLNDKLIGFNTLILNGEDTVDTYFLGYDDEHQKSKMLYLNMLYDMIGYTITKNYSKLIFSRTALEIKSSVGAKPVEMVGFIKHSNGLINFYMAKLFKYFDPEVTWIERNPFNNLDKKD
jgi:predicted N-acyltransferase